MKEVDPRRVYKLFQMGVGEEIIKGAHIWFAQKSLCEVFRFSFSNMRISTMKNYI